MIMRMHVAVLLMGSLLVGTVGWCEPIGIDTPPYTSRGQAMLPIHAVAEWLGAQIETDETAETFTMRYHDVEMRLRAGDHHALVNGEQVPIDGRPTMEWSHVESRDGHLYLPMVFIGETLGIQAKWFTTAGGFATLSLKDNDEKVAAVAQFPLHWAAANGETEVARMLLDHGIEVNTQCKSGWTALYWAAHYGHTETAKLLLDRSANVNAKDPTLGWAPLHFAGYRGHADTAALLLERGADANIANVWGEVPLHWAARRGHTDTIAVLVEKGANLDAAESGGLTPLHFAATWGHPEAVKLLLEKGANASAETHCGRTALYWARKWNHSDIVELLVKNGATH
jgi:hypothetical protein